MNSSSLPNQPRWMILGSGGMLGSEFVTQFRQKRVDFDEKDRSNFSISEKSDALQKLLAEYDIVVNCIAYTKVDQAEAEPELAFEVNAEWPGRLAEACNESGAHLIHISTDYVFDGTNQNGYRIFDDPKPISTYGKSKLAGEEAIANTGSKYSIFRTAWLYGQFGKCFPRTIQSRLAAGIQSSIVDDQIGSPTWTQDLVDLILRHVEIAHLPKIVHATSQGSCSWYEFAKEIASSGGYSRDLIKPIKSSEYPTPAIRPKNSVLLPLEGPAGKIGNWKDRWEIAAHLFRN